jgi:hypothetical protein
LSAREAVAASRSAERANAKHLEALIQSVASAAVDYDAHKLTAKELKHILQILLGIQDGRDVREPYGTTKKLKVSGRPSKDGSNILIVLHVFVLRAMYNTPRDKVELLYKQVAPHWETTWPYVKKLCSTLRKEANRLFEEVGGLEGAKKLIVAALKQQERHRRELIPKPR